MSKKMTSSDLREVEERIKSGYVVSHGREATSAELEALSKRQIKHLYKKGASKNGAKNHKVLYRSLIIIIPIVAVASILAYLYVQSITSDNDQARSPGILSSQPSFSVNRSSSPSHNGATPAANSETPKPGNTANGSNNNKQYIPSKCTTESIPFKYVRENVTYLNVGETRKYPGRNGTRYTCTADSNGEGAYSSTSPPMDDITYIGTRTPNTSNSGPTYTYEEALYRARSNCSFAGDSSAYDLCVSLKLKSYGY